MPVLRDLGCSPTYARLSRSIAWLLIVIAVVVAVVLYLRHRKAKDEAPSLRTAAVERRDVVVSVTAVGALEPLTTVDVKANVAGEIVELAVDRGDYVKNGDLIARIDPTETRSAYDQARADVAAALARVQQSTTDLHRQRELTPAQIQAAQDATDSAIARTDQARATLDYQRKSTEASIQQATEALDAARAWLKQAEELAKAQPQLTAATIQQRDAAERASKEALNRLVQATQPQERAVAKSSLEAARVSLENEKKALERSRALFNKGFLAKQGVEDAA
jgi:multidrug efflux pump subunit AcrA (membrane-fusion protein)